MRPAWLATIALLCACLGAVAALAIGRGAGWIGNGTTDTVAVPSPPQPRAASAQTVLDSGSIGKPLPGNGFDPAKIYARQSAGVVTIYAFFGNQRAATEAAQGSGFVVSKRGYILTSSHVVTNAGEQHDVKAAGHVYVEYSDRDRVAARIVGWDVFDDVAVLKVDPRQHPVATVPLGNSANVVVGQPVAAIGSPFGNADSLATGVVSAVHRSISSLTSQFVVPDAIQTDAPINHGNSGGPLFDARGRVIGINAQIRSDSGNAEGVGFAVPINAARRSMVQLIATGHVLYPYVGVKTQDLTPSAARHFGFRVRRGAVIVEVTPGSPAERAGLRAATGRQFFDGDPAVPVDGDVIVAIGDEPVRGADDVLRIVSERLAAGEHETFTIVRGTKRLRVELRLAQRPANAPP
jgi:S1-C subfamily serine protease